MCTDLSVLFVRRGIVGDFEEVQVDHFFHLVVVSSPLTNNDRSVKQEDVPAIQKCSSKFKHIFLNSSCYSHRGVMSNSVFKAKSDFYDSNKLEGQYLV